VSTESIEEQMLRFEHWALRDQLAVLGHEGTACPVCYPQLGLPQPVLRGKRTELIYEGEVPWRADLSSDGSMRGIWYTRSSGESWCWSELGPHRTWLRLVKIEVGSAVWRAVAERTVY
jgi:hypothetical protein